MEASTTINKMFAGNKFFVPTYHRAYSWESPSHQNSRNLKTHTDVFLKDLLDYNSSSAKTPYYFGHFLFEEKGDSYFGVIDGQQRLTTIVIFLSALYCKLKTIRVLSEDEEVLYENMIKRKSYYIFSTVDYDNQLLRDYVIDQTKKNKNGLKTDSAKRIVKAFDFFMNSLADDDEQLITKLLKTISESTCTTYLGKSESEAIKMFIFHNNRGKR